MSASLMIRTAACAERAPIRDPTLLYTPHPPTH